MTLHLGNLVPFEADLAATFVTKRDGSPRLYFLRLAPDCTVVSQKHLVDMPAGEQIQVVKNAPYGQCLLVAWREAEAQTKLAIVDSDGRFAGEPQSVAHSLPVHDDLIVLPGGDVAWLTAKSPSSPFA